MIKHILISGATGFIGSHLLGELTGSYEIAILKKSNSCVDRIKDYLDKIKMYDVEKDGIKKAFQENQIDLVVNLAVDFGRGGESKIGDIIETNVVFAVRLLEESRAHNVKYFFSPDSALNPRVSAYAFSKYVLKQILKDYFGEDTQIFNLKLEYVFGENDDSSKFISLAVNKLLNNELVSMSPGEQELDFIYVKDCVRAIRHIIDHVDDYKNHYEELEIGTGKTIKLKDFILMIKEKLNSTSEISFGTKEYRHNEHMYSRADISKLQGWAPKYSIDNIDFNKFKINT